MAGGKTIKPIEKPGVTPQAQPEAGGILKSKISKRAYVFDTRRKYSVSRSFLVKKKPETPMEDAKDQLLALFSNKKRGEGANSQADAPQKKPGPQAAASKPNSGTFTVLLTAIAVVFLFIIGGAIYVAMLLGAASEQETQPQNAGSFAGVADFSIKQAEMLSVQGERGRQAFFLVEYASENLTALNFSTKLLTGLPTTQAFLLNHPREGDDTYPAFRQELLRGLPAAGIPVNEIEIRELGAMPGGATLIVPTGYFPQGLLDPAIGIDYKSLLSRGANIIYIGYEFDKTALGADGQTVSSPIGKGEISFSKGSPPSTGGFGLFDPQYAAYASGGGLSGANSLYGSVSAIKYGEGAMLILPQTIDGGWRGNGKAAADDVIRIIKDEGWIAPAAQSNTSVDIKSAPAGKLSVFAPPFALDFARVEMIATMADQNGMEQRSIKISDVGKKQKGELYPYDQKIAPYYVSGQKTRLNMKLNENSTAQVKLYVRIYQDGVLEQDEELELGLTNPTTEKSKDIAVNVPPGIHVVRIEDNEGKVYAATRLDVIGPSIERAPKKDSLDWKEGKFTFLISVGGIPAMPRELSISMDGKGERSYTQSSLTRSGEQSLVDYSYPGQIAPGAHEFKFKFGDWSATVNEQYRLQKQPWDNPLVVILGLMAIGVIAIGVIFKRKEVLRYGLDIPDFPPLATIKIPMKRETVLGVFDSVNAAYSWQWMPLRPEEIKNGFRRLTYNGKPILIGDFNLERVLAKLIDEGLVKEEIGYFGLSQWENASGRTIRYLAIYRVMRNVFVNNAVKFTKLGAVPECDVKAVMGKEEVYLHIMEDPFGKKDAGQKGIEPGGRRLDAESVAHRALASAKKGTSLIIFATEEERDAFSDSLVSTSKLAVGLKMEINNGNILLLPVKNELSSYLRGMSR